MRVLVINPPRPVPRESPCLSGFRLAAACEGIAPYLMDKVVYALEHILVGLLPVEVVLPAAC